MKPIIIPNISIPTIGIPTIGIPSVGFPSASGGGGLSWPAGMKEHIKAWYDPKKQKLTNYDVIESYTEDFTSNNWKHTNNVTVTSNSFRLTYGNLTYELYPIKDYNTKPMTVIVKGLVGIKGFIRYRYGQKDYIDINKDGVYYLPAKD